MENRLQDIERIRAEAEKCISCGLCLYACPVYAKQPEEDVVARGRNRLIKEVADDHRDLTVGMADRFGKCLLCRRCTMVCPRGIRTDLITMAARAEMVKGDGLSLAKRTVFRRLMKDKKSLARAVRAAARFQWMFPTTREPEGKVRHLTLEEAGKIRHVPWFIPGLAGRQFPSIAEAFLGEQIGEVHAPPAGVEPRGLRVAFFPGCAVEFSFPEVAKASIRQLTHCGVEVVCPEDQTCCGIPVQAVGDLETAREMALRNLEIFAKVEADVVITACPGCMVQLIDNIERHGLKQRVVHIAEAIRPDDGA